MATQAKILVRSTVLMRHLRYIIALLILSAMSVYGWYRANEEKQYCGVIKYKVEATRWSKSSANSDPIFVINFEKLGTREIHPTWDDFLSKKTGDRICYGLPAPGASHVWVLLTLVCIGALFSLIIMWVFKEW